MLDIRPGLVLIEKSLQSRSNAEYTQPTPRIGITFPMTDARQNRRSALILPQPVPPTIELQMSPNP